LTTGPTNKEGEISKLNAFTHFFSLYTAQIEQFLFDFVQLLFENCVVKIYTFLKSKLKALERGESQQF